MYESNTCSSYLPCNRIPLLPRPCPSPSTFSGVAHSTCNWQSPNSCFVEMLPVPLTVATPSFTSHLAGPFLSPFHCNKSFASNSTIASEGGGPGSIIRGSSFGGGISAVESAARDFEEMLNKERQINRGIVFM